jgi:hypothetical protein
MHPSATTPSSSSSGLVRHALRGRLPTVAWKEAREGTAVAGQWATGGGLQGGDTKRIRVGQGGGDGGRRERAAWPRPGGLPPSSLAPSHDYPFPPPHQHNPHHPCCESLLVAFTVRVLSCSCCSSLLWVSPGLIH